MYATRKFENTKGVIRREAVNRRTDNTIAKKKKKKDKQRSTKHYTENKRSSNTNPIKKTGVNSGDPEVSAAHVTPDW